MKRLKDSLIKQSRLIDQPQFQSRNSRSSRNKKIQKIYKFALNPRGGQIEDINLAAEFSKEFKLAQKIKQIIERTIIFIKTKENNTKLTKFIFIALRSGIEFVLIQCNINLQCIITDELKPEIVILALSTGGTFGFIHGWFAAGFFLALTPSVLSVFLVRSLFQQYMHFRQYQRVLEISVKLSKDPEYRKAIMNKIDQINKQIEENMNLINLETLNWNKNPSIKQAAKRLGIFEKSPKIDGPLHINTLDVDLEVEQMLEDLGLLQKSKIPSTEELNEFLKSNPMKIRTMKDIVTDNVIMENELEIK